MFQYKLFKLLNNISNNINITILMFFYVLVNNLKNLLLLLLLQVKNDLTWLLKWKEYFLITLFTTNSFFYYQITLV